MSKVEKAFSKFMGENQISKDKKVIVALSGGPDSVALLLLARGYFKNVVAAHVNHNLRGEESDSEQAYCEELCSALVVPRVPLFVKVLTKDEVVNGSQSKYRELRYDFLKQIYVDEDVDYLLLGHHKNDQVETVFYNIVKGTGLNGLVGIKRKNVMNEMNMLRPIIDIKKKELLSYLDDNGYAYKTDSSNLKQDYARNKIRLNLLPTIEKELEVNLESSLISLSQSMEEIQDFMKEETLKLRTQILTQTEGKMLVRTEAIRDKHIALVKNFMYELLVQDLRIDVHKSHVEEILKLLRAENGSVSMLPNGWVCTKKQNSLVFMKPEAKQRVEGIRIRRGEKIQLKIGTKKYEIHFAEAKVDGVGHVLCFDEMPNELQIMSYEKGREIKYKEDGHKKVKKILKESGIEDLEEGWYFKNEEEVVFLPQANFIAYDYRNNSRPYKINIEVKEV